LSGFVFKVRRTLSRPGRLGVASKEKDSMAWNYAFGPFDPPSAPDVVSREVTVELSDGSPSIVLTYPVDQMQTDVITVPEGNHIKVSYLEIDDAGNRSGSAPFLEDDAIDKQAPPGPTNRLGIVTKVEV
jgi:hypothetical protein